MVAACQKVHSLRVLLTCSCRAVSHLETRALNLQPTLFAVVFPWHRLAREWAGVVFRCVLARGVTVSAVPEPVHTGGPHSMARPALRATGKPKGNGVRGRGRSNGANG